MRTTHMMKAAGLVLAAVILGLLVVQGSYALWNKQASMAAGTVQAADFRISLTDTNASNTTDMTLPNGTAATLALSTSPIGVLVPGKPAYAGVAIANVTNASGDFTVQATMGTVSIQNDAGGLAGFLNVKAVAAASLDKCPDASLFTGVPTSALPSESIAKNSSTAICFQVMLAPTAPASTVGKSASISIPLLVTQKS
ncbi:hypothetical protein [Arthrobacter cryoconiti]|uniref:Ribosomally synthesized peptide with SipW-like signal peptide n=1 Tax=Arthrobacter cryoconiti TaxID=748907 RepID=A0ABV8R362_9MICC|nr:hypothetical protein [Arthrobacter cryoconiti]MCC9067029.1 hypothetical protein [Arthrobacter cryoconiti]